MRKNAQTLTVNEKPKERAEYNKLEVLGGDPFGAIGVLDTWVPAKEKNRNKNVPTNSPIAQSRSYRISCKDRNIFGGTNGLDWIKGIIT